MSSGGLRKAGGRFARQMERHEGDVVEGLYLGNEARKPSTLGKSVAISLEHGSRS